MQSGRGDIRPPPPQPLMSATPQGFANQQQQRGGPQAPNQNQRMPMMSPFGMPPMGMAPPAGMHQGGFPAQGFPHGGMGPPQGMGGLPQGMAPGPGMQGMPPGMPMMPFGFQQFPNQGMYVSYCILAIIEYAKNAKTEIKHSNFPLSNPLNFDSSLFKTRFIFRQGNNYFIV